MRWKMHPFLFLTPFFIAGILLNNYHQRTEIHEYWFVLFFIIILSIYFVLSPSVHKKLVPLSTIALGLCFILVGFLVSQFTWQTNSLHLSADELARITAFTARIDSKPDKKAKSTKYEIAVEKVKIDDIWQSLNSKAVLYDLDSGNFNYGDIILIMGKPKLLERQKNPHAFDYSLYLQRKGIFLQAFCQHDKYLVLEENHYTSPRYWTMRIGDIFEDILSKNIPSDRELNIAKAMVVGRRNEITPEMEYAYEATGTSHILAVSGLHVGIIYLVVSSLLKFANRKGLAWFYYSAVLFSIWSFAVITGFSPSVRRAALMFTLILLAKMIHRKSSIYNTIFASAFCILLFSPNLIFSVSFQFSYMAVLGIVFLYKKIYPLVYLKNKFLDFFWQITALSFSVQLATFSINIYYFHHFPSLFPITNLFAIPTAMVVVMGSLVIFFTSILGIVPEIIGMVVGKWIFYYNELMVFFSKLSITSIEGLYLKGIYVFLLIFLTLLLVRFIETRRLYFVKLFTFLLLISSIIVVADKQINANQKVLFIYDIDNCLSLDVFLGNTCYSNVKDHNEKTAMEIYYNIEPNQQYHLISEVKPMEKLPYYSKIGKNQLIIMNEQSILILKEPMSLSPESKKVEIDFVVLGKSSIKYFERIMKFINIKNVILDATFRDWEVEQAIESLPEDIHIHAISRDGAWQMSI